MVVPVVYCASSTQEAEEGLRVWGQLSYATQQDVLQRIPATAEEMDSR